MSTFRKILKKSFNAGECWTFLLPLIQWFSVYYCNINLTNTKRLTLHTVVIKFHGLQPDNITNLNDDLIATCSRFATDKHQYTQIFKKVNCSNDRMSVTLIGQDMNCTDSIYVVGLTGSDAGKANNKWKTCLSRWQTTTDDNVDWCIYDCTCTGGCEELMVLRWPNILTSSSFTLCDISYHCNGKILVFYFGNLFAYFT